VTKPINAILSASSAGYHGQLEKMAKNEIGTIIN